ncbi:MAG: hypothetical protein Q4G66_00965 [bacterium]|nr:hypothetical protein [bacterium]
MRKFDSVLGAVLDSISGRDPVRVHPFEDDELTDQEQELLVRFLTEFSDSSVFHALMPRIKPFVYIEPLEEAHLWMGLVKLKNLLEM